MSKKELKYSKTMRKSLTHRQNRHKVYKKFKTRSDVQCHNAIGNERIFCCENIPEANIYNH